METLRFAVGMPVDELNSQPVLAEQPRRLDKKSPDSLTVVVPHRLAIEVNGSTILFETGSPQAPTFIANGFYIHNSLEGRDRVRTVMFNTTVKPVSLEQAMALASRYCAGMRAAKLSPRKGQPFGLITEELGTRSTKPISGEKDIIEAFRDTDVRPRNIIFCTLEDEGHEFELSLTNGRRTRQGSRPPDESEVMTEEVYRLSASFSQNIHVASERGQRAERLARGK